MTSLAWKGRDREVGGEQSSRRRWHLGCWGFGDHGISLHFYRPQDLRDLVLFA